MVLDIITEMKWFPLPMLLITFSLLTSCIEYNDKTYKEDEISNNFTYKANIGYFHTDEEKYRMIRIPEDENVEFIKNITYANKQKIQITFFTYNRTNDSNIKYIYESNISTFKKWYKKNETPHIIRNDEFKINSIINSDFCFPDSVSCSIAEGNNVIIWNDNDEIYVLFSREKKIDSLTISYNFIIHSKDGKNWDYPILIERPIGPMIILEDETIIIATTGYGPFVYLLFFNYHYVNTTFNELYEFSK